MSVKDRVKLIALLKGAREEARYILHKVGIVEAHVETVIQRVNYLINEIEDLDKTG